MSLTTPEKIRTLQMSRMERVSNLLIEHCVRESDKNSDVFTCSHLKCMLGKCRSKPQPHAAKLKKAGRRNRIPAPHAL
jgi:hypothetical protein